MSWGKGNEGNLPRRMPVVQTCDLVTTREARQRLEEYVWPIISTYSYGLPTKCPFRKGADAMAFLEKAKSRKASKRWVCKICEKKFTSSDFLDAHIQHSHADLADLEGTVCYGDYCSILQCPSTPLPDTSQCDTHQMQALRLQCEAIMHECFPASGSSLGHQLNDYFVDLFCDPIVCDSKRGVSLTMPEKVDSVWSSSVVKIMGFCAVCVVLGVFYIGACVHYSDSRRSPYMKRIGKKGDNMWARVFSSSSSEST